MADLAWSDMRESGSYDCWEEFMRGRARFRASAPESVIGCQKGLGIKRPAVHLFNARTVGVTPPVALPGDHNVIDPHFGDTAVFCRLNRTGFVGGLFP